MPQTETTNVKQTMKWDSFESHLLASQKELYFTKQFSDVTLVSDDFVEFLAHKTILSTASSMLKTLLGMSSQQQSSFIYLKGIVFLILYSTFCINFVFIKILIEDYRTLIYY